MNNRIQFHQKAHFYLALLIAFCLPVATLTPFFIAFMLLNWLVEGDFKNKFNTLLKNKFTLLFLSFYAMHLIGLLYTQNTDSGLFDVQVKLSLLIFPLILVSRPLPKDKIEIVFFAFIFGEIVSSVIMLSKAIYTYFTLSLNRFFYAEFSFLIHPSYLSMYINLCVGWLLFKILKNEFKGKRFSNFWAILTTVFLSFINVLLASKMGLATMVLVFMGFLIYYIIEKKRYLFGFIGALLIVGSMFSAMKLFPEMAGRVNRSIDALTNATPNESDSESTAVRLLVWKAANQVVSENLLFGVGTGDAKDVLMKEYEKRGMTGAIEHKLNTHNEYYQVLVSIGLIGLVLLLLNLFVPLRYAIKTADPIYLLFLLIVIFNFIPESMLETQAGVMFYGFFNSLLCFSPRISESNNLV